METPTVIWQDDSILALNKPSGWVVNDSNTVSDSLSLQGWVAKNFKFEISNSKLLRGGIVHRLDKPTSGVILVGKTRQIFETLQKEFADRDIDKTYIALVHGRVEPSEGIIDAPVGRLPWKRTKFGVFEGGRSAQTEYKILRYYGIKNQYTLLELHPRTGRTHQLRVHLKYVGHPIVADPLYVGRKILREDLKEFPRLWLHAKSIEFTHPIEKKRMKIEAPLPQELKLD